MAADRFDTKAVRDIVSHLARIATSTERIADALEAANAADPVQAIQAAIEAEAKQAPQEPAPAQPPDWMLR